MSSPSPPGEPPGAPEAPSIELPIDGVLDLHTFDPRDVKALVPEYLAECRAHAIFDVRIIHGKGTGTLREVVRGLLARDPTVERFTSASEPDGGWGATLVRLRP